MNLADRFQEIQERLAKATPGPWRADARGWQVLSDHANICGLNDGHDSKYWREEGRDTGQGPPNADFIAHAPDDIEFLLAFAARKEDDVEKLVDILNSHGLLHEETDQETAERILDEAAPAMNAAWAERVLAAHVAAQSPERIQELSNQADRLLAGEVETRCATCGDRRYVRMEASFIYPADGDVGQLRSCPDCGEVETSCAPAAKDTSPGTEEK